LNTEKSKLKWTGEKIAGYHTGFVGFQSGQIEFDGKKISSGNIRMNMKTITCIDLKSRKYNEKLIRHLKGEDFFNVEKFKYAELKVVSFREGDEKKQGWITGEITIKGISHELEFPVSFEQKNNNWVFMGKTAIDRSKFQIRYKSPSFFNDLGDSMIKDEFKLEFYLIFPKSDKL
jgi:polyisoprenoid-binding protein YceI